jgi:hypothetical protein
LARPDRFSDRSLVARPGTPRRRKITQPNCPRAIPDAHAGPPR